MIKSMTGFGRASGTVNGRSASVEVRAVNSKGLDLSVKIPSRYRERENELRLEAGRLLERGKIDLLFRFEDSNEETKLLTLNKNLAKVYYEELKSFSEDLSVPVTDLLSVVLKLPDVYSSESKSGVEDEEWKEVTELCQKAITNFDSFRSAEGKTLSTDLNNRVSSILSLLKTIEEQEPARIKQIKDRINKGLNEIATEQQIDRNRFEQEIIYYLEKIDITEEKVRLLSHCDYFRQTSAEAASAGRKLGFIAQEMGREINTIGSKANDATIQRQVVQMKDELEKIKEQVLNIL